MFAREMEKELLDLAEQYLVVTVLGPRQSGKTTLVRSVFPKKPYLNLEDPDIRELAELDPRHLLNRYPDGAILDEIQRVPALLSYIQVIVDEKKQKGMFILTGSHQLELHQTITQSLAGRTALLQLLPMSIAELTAAGFNLTVDEYLLKGCYPRIFSDHLDPTKAYRNYLQTYIERDLRQLEAVKDLSQFQRFLKLCAGRIGQILNMESLGNELGISNHTVKNWLSLLQASFIIVLLQPYYENFGKRIIKAPKLYFVDVGLASYLLGIENLKQVERDPLRGNLFENLAVLEMIKTRTNRGMDPQLYFYRDSNMNEVDVIYKSGDQLIPIEVKSSVTFKSDFFKALNFFKKITEERCGEGYLVYAGDQEQTVKSFEILNYKHINRIFK